MTASIYDHSKTAASNTAILNGITLDGSVMTVPQIDNAFRDYAAQIAMFRDDITGTITAGGSANALTVTANSGFTTLANGRMVSFIAASDNTTAATLAVNGLSAQSIRKMDSTGDVALSGGEIQAGGIYLAVYNSALNSSAGGWLLINPSLSTALSNFPTSSTDNTLPRFDGTAGRLQTSDIVVNDSNNMSGIGTIASGAITSSAGIAGTTGTFSSSVSASSLSTTGAISAGTTVTAGTQVFAASGALATLSYSFTGDTNTGVYNSADGRYVIVSNGSASGIFLADGLHIENIEYSMSDAAVGLALYNTDPIINIGRTSNAGLQVKRRSTDGAAVNLYKNETNVGSISVTAAATAYNTSSDENLKDFIGVYDPQKAIEIIRRDPVRDFHWKASGNYAVGWGAQTSYAVSSDLASPGRGKPGDANYEPWGVDQGKRTPYLWAALSNVLDRLETVEAKLAALGGSNQEQP